ncbi:hypothetical protein RMATCC62417_04833 [Rhizopus microsporus]|nr:hypothetical protein RMATCC62417_04833 [Rhizopus microsporus]
MESVYKEFELSQETFKAIVQGFISEYNHGLNTASASGLATMIPSYVTCLPTGQETGTFLSLDLGGSTLRVCAVELLGQSKVKVTQIRQTIAPNDPIRTSEATEFFDWIALAVAQLVHKLGSSKPLSMGVCWSFPIDQTSISKGKILRMGKGFTIKGLEGHDLSDLLHAAFQRRGVPVRVTALVNDTVGTLVAHAYTNPNTRIGFIYGTGVNAAYPEEMRRITKLHGYQQEGKMLINTEIDIFGSESYLPLNKYDRELDKSHSQPKFQLYEKMMSGAYIGELVRLAALDLIQQGHLFQSHRPKEFDVPLEFDTAIPSDIESCLELAPQERLARFSSHFSFSSDDNYVPTLHDLDIFTQICLSVSNRAAQLAAAAMVSLIEQQDDLLRSTEPIVIGINGSTFEKYPAMSNRIQQSLATWFGPKISQRIQLEIATDGGSIGGALIAMLVGKEQKTTYLQQLSRFSCLWQWLSFFKSNDKADKEKDLHI